MLENSNRKRKLKDINFSPVITASSIALFCMTIKYHDNCQLRFTHCLISFMIAHQVLSVKIGNIKGHQKKTCPMKMKKKSKKYCGFFPNLIFLANLAFLMSNSDIFDNDQISWRLAQKWCFVFSFQCKFFSLFSAV